MALTGNTIDMSHYFATYIVKEFDKVEKRRGEYKV
ncbi:MAG: hypothetical protein CM15mP83_8220 [Flavobacteriaceae bacterium]|nr:MAG: hypothetical protein CM15mP83_8220 [Flavobacteriaceae bacterium]